MRRIRRRAAGLVVLVLSLVGACADPPSDPERRVVAFVGEQPVYTDDVERYLRHNLLQEEEEGDLDAIKSRLFDAMIEERLLLAEAERREIGVNRQELEAYLDPDGQDPETGGDQRPPGRAEDAVRTIKVQKLQTAVAESTPPPSEEELGAFVEQHRERLMPSEQIELRALPLRSKEVADRVYGEIRRRRMTFREAVVRYEPIPGQSEALRISWNNLSEELREALGDLKPGRVSKPLELHGSYYLFEVGSRLDDPEQQEAELRRRALLELEARRRQAQLDALIDQLRQRFRVRLRTENLGFRYVPA